MKNKNNSGGFIKMIIIVVGALVLLKYVYNIDVIDFLTQGRFKDWLDKLYNIATLGWAKYSEVIIKVWNYFLNFIKNIFSK